MAEEEGLLELKFRLHDGTDLGPNMFSPDTTIATLKEHILTHWPEDTQNGPRSINDIKLINAGKLLENSRTIAESQMHIADLPAGVITMHVVVHLPTPEHRAGRQASNLPKKNGCACCIL